MRKRHYMVPGVVALVSLGVVAEFVARREPRREVDYEYYAATLRSFVDDDGRVDYRGLRENRERLDRFIRSLMDFSPRAYYRWSDAEKIALWINACNAHVLQVVIDNYPIRPSAEGKGFPRNSVRQIPGAFDKKPMMVMGVRVTAQEIRELLRKNFNEPRVHLALVPGAVGGPPLRREPYTGGLLEKQLDEQAAGFVRNPAYFRIDRVDNVVLLSQVFRDYGGDFIREYGGFRQSTRFSDDQQAVLNFVSRFAGRQEQQYLLTEDYTIKYIDYDWSLNVRSTDTGRKWQFR